MRRLAKMQPFSGTMDERWFWGKGGIFLVNYHSLIGQCGSYQEVCRGTVRRWSLVQEGVGETTPKDKDMHFKMHSDKEMRYHWRHILSPAMPKQTTHLKKTQSTQMPHLQFSCINNKSIRHSYKLCLSCGSYQRCFFLISYNTQRKTFTLVWHPERCCASSNKLFCVYYIKILLMQMFMPYRV